MKNKRNIGNNVVLTKFSSSFTDARKITQTIPKSLFELVNIYNGIVTQTLLSLRKERSGRKSSPRSERRNAYRTRAKQTTRITVGLCDGMLLLYAQLARQDGRWKGSIREEIW